MHYAYAAIALIAVPLIRVRGFYGYVGVKEHLLYLLTGLMAAYALFTGFPAIGDFTTLALVAFLLYACVSLVWSDHPADAVKDLPRWASLVLLFLFCRGLPMDFVLVALFLPAPVIAVYGISQKVFHYDPLARDDTRERFNAHKLFYSFLGNSNHAGAYLAPEIFVGLYLGLNCSPWFFIPLAFVALGLAATRCLAAQCAVIIALAVSGFWEIAALFSVAGAIGFLAKMKSRSIGYRWILVRLCWGLFRQNPLFGLGPRAFRRRHQRILAELNKRQPDILGTPDKPGKYIDEKGTKAHNDYAEMLAEYGIIGSALFCIFLGSLFSMATAYPILLGALVATAIDAGFFYAFRAAATALPFFAVAAVVLGPGPGCIHIHPVMACPLVPVIGYLLYLFTYKPFQAARYWADKHILKAVKAQPGDSTYLANAAMQALKYGHKLQAQEYAEKAYYWYDGEVTLYSLLNLYGTICLMNGTPLRAQQLFKQAIYLNPGEKEAYDRLAQVEPIVEQMRNVRHEARPGATASENAQIPESEV